MAMSYSSVLGWEEWEVDTASFWEKKKKQHPEPIIRNKNGKRNHQISQIYYTHGESEKYVPSPFGI